MKVEDRNAKHSLQTIVSDSISTEDFPYAIFDRGYLRALVCKQIGLGDKPTGAKEFADLISAAPDMLIVLEQAENLIIEMAQVIYKKELADHLPWGLFDKVRAWVRESPAHIAIKKARTGE